MAPSNSPTATPGLAPTPAPPRNLDVVGRRGGISLAWSASVTGGVTYSVHRGVSAGGSKEVLASGLVGLRYDDYAVIAGQRYYYVVHAHTSAGQSAPSNEVTTRAR
jgi:hypothetical protein